MTSKTKQWSDEYYVQCYQLARSGSTNRQMADAFGISLKVFNKWLADHPALGKGIRLGRNKDLGLQAKYIYGKLSEKAQYCWQRIMAVEKEKNAVRRIESLFNAYGDGIRKEIFLHVMAGTLFNTSTACRRVNISLSQFKRWVEEDLEFANLLDEMQVHKDNLYDEAFTEVAIKDKNPAVLIHAAKTRLKNRGFGDELKIKHTGEINSNHTWLLDDKLLDLLSLNSKREVMEAMIKLQEMQQDQERKMITVDQGV